MLLFNLTLIILILTFASGDYTEDTAPDGFETEVFETHRLPPYISPTHYILEIKPYLNSVPAGKTQFQFDGSVTILFNIAKDDVDEIILHQQDLNITSQKLVRDGLEEIDIENIEFDTERSFLILRFKHVLDAKYGYILKFQFEGILNDQADGFYRSSYENDSGNITWIGSTQFQPNYARTVFPCFDEPQLKAEFQLTIDHENELHAVSNMNIFKKSVYGDRVKSHFMRSPKMSTYTLGFVISNFIGPSDEEFKLLARPNNEVQAQLSYVFHLVPKILKTCNDYFAIDYQSLGVGKMYIIALEKLNSAMENWGLITAREEKVLYHPDHTTAKEQQLIFDTIVHEITHMWFGNYVTLDWWSHVWLNEGFARYFESIIPNMINPNCESEKLFVIEDMHDAMKIDAEIDSIQLTSIQINLKNPKPLFSPISYDKGAALIRMFKYVIGDRKFKRAVRTYLDTWGHKSTKPDDIFDEFEKEWELCTVEQRKFFHDWTKQFGYPLVLVKLIDNGTKFEVRQERYFLETYSGAKELDYMIPITYATEKNPNFSLPQTNKFEFMKSGTISLPKTEHLQPEEYLIINIGQVGYFRVHYEDNMLRNIRRALDSDNHGGISDLNRAHLIDDLFKLAQSNHYSYRMMFFVLKYLQYEVEYLPWYTALKNFELLKEKIGQNLHLKPYVAKLLHKVYHSITYNESQTEKLVETYKRSLILNWAFKYEFPDFKEKTYSIFRNFQNNPTHLINKNIREIIYCSAIRFDSIDNYNFLMGLYRLNSTSGLHKFTLLKGLSCIGNKQQIENHFNFILSDDVPPNFKKTAISLLVYNSGDKLEVLRLITKNILKLAYVKPDLDHDIAIEFVDYTRGFSTDNEGAVIAEAIDAHPEHLLHHIAFLTYSYYKERRKWIYDNQDHVIASLNANL